MEEIEGVVAEEVLKVVAVNEDKGCGAFIGGFEDFFGRRMSQTEGRFRIILSMEGMDPFGWRGL